MNVSDAGDSDVAFDRRPGAGYFDASGSLRGANGVSGGTSHQVLTMGEVIALSKYGSTSKSSCSRGLKSLAVMKVSMCSRSPSNIPVPLIPTGSGRSILGAMPIAARLPDMTCHSATKDAASQTSGNHAFQLWP